MANIEEKVENLLLPTIEQLGYDLYDVEYTKEGKNYFLRIYIDKNAGIDLNDCEKVNNAISNLLDTADYIKDMYFLEVSSPGIERVLRKEKHLKQNIGKKIEVRLFQPIQNKKEMIGILNDFNEDVIQLEVENQIIEIDRKKVSIIKRVYDW